MSGSSAALATGITVAFTLTGMFIAFVFHLH